MDYRSTVLEYARRLIDKSFSNGTMDHAAAITEAMLLTARGSYKVYTGSFNADFFGRPDIVNALEDFFKRDAFPSIKVLVQNGVLKEDLKCHPWIKIAEKYGRTIDVRNAVGNYATDEAHHFSIVDKTGYRYEFDKNVRATANFYDPKTVANLDTVFEEAFEYAA